MLGMQNMTIEYRLEKKVLGGWQSISWWSEAEYDKAITSYNSLAKPNCGFAYRLIKIEVMQECRLEEEKEISYKDEVAKIWSTPESELKNDWKAPPVKISDWGATPVADGWGKPAVLNPRPAGEGKPGAPGSVSLIHHGLKQRKRFKPEEVDDMIAQGWERGGARTQFRS